MVGTAYVWQGDLSIGGLFPIPVQLYAATGGERPKARPRFRLLCPDHHQPITEKKWCPVKEHEVADDAVVKGVEAPGGGYTVVTQDEVKEAKPESTDIAEIVKFLDIQKIDPICYRTHYFATPTKGHERPYRLFQARLAARRLAGVGQVVMRKNPSLFSVGAYAEILRFSTLYYVPELRDPGDLVRLKPQRYKAAERRMADQLLDAYLSASFDHAKFKDTYARDLEKLLRQKAQTEGAVQPAPSERALLDQLMASLAQAPKKPGPRKRR